MIAYRVRWSCVGEKSALHLFWTALFAGIAIIWITQGIRAIRGMSRLPRLAEINLPSEADWPSISLIFAARDEAEKLPGALQTLLAQDYPHHEVVAADDRSQDSTPQILDRFARTHQRLKVVHVAELPSGWLGKPHALLRAYEQSAGDWLVFTDADVHFAPDLLHRAMALTQERGWDHLTLVGSLDLRGFWEKTATIYFGIGFTFGVEPWRVHDPRSRRYMGMGYFQLLRRSAYHAIGTHRRLAMEVVDDMKLGKLVKQGGFRSGVAMAQDRLRLRWNKGLGETVRGVTKNFFAASGYSVLRTAGNILAILALSVLPFLALVVTSGLAQLLAAFTAGVGVTLYAWAARNYQLSWLYGFTHPLGALLFCYMLLRSMVVTLWRGGVVWRDTFYPLEELRKGVV